MDVARLNLSHGNRDEHARRLEAIRQVAAAGGRPVAIMFDTRGPEIRLGRFAGGKAILEAGRAFTLTPEEISGSESRASVGYPRLAADLGPGDTVLLDDGNISLCVEEVRPPAVLCRVLNGGEISDRKKVSLPGAKLDLPALADADRADLAYAARAGVEYVAASFVRKAADILDIRKILEDSGSEAHIIAKIENREGVENLDDILKVADGLMVARGDLGVEFPAEEVPLLQKTMIERANRLGKPVITATQMLESMIERPRPTRAEASDVANAIFDGTDAVMLSAETATGRYPVEAVRVMARIAERTEEALPYDRLLAARAAGKTRTVTDAVSHATCQAATDLGAAAILTATQSGHTARMVAKYRPRAPIVALTPIPAVARKLNLVWGVLPLIIPGKRDTDQMIDQAVNRALEAGAIQAGDLVVITAGVPAGIPGTTNLIKVHTVGDILVRGTGIGTRSASGPACIVRTAREAAERFRAGDILVTEATDADFIPYMEKAAGVVTEEGGLTSHAAVAGLSLGVPVIVGAGGATGVIDQGSEITLDVPRGVIYRGRAVVK